jgi:hypothetical protein
VRTPAGFDGSNPLRWQGLVANEKLSIFLGENVIGHDRDVVAVAKPAAEREQQRRLAASDRTTNANRERTRAIVALERRTASLERSWTVELRTVMFVIVRMMVKHWASHDDTPCLRLKQP